MSHTQSPYIATTIFKYFTVVIIFRQFVSHLSYTARTFSVATVNDAA